MTAKGFILRRLYETSLSIVRFSRSTAPGGLIEQSASQKEVEVSGIEPLAS